MKVETVTRDTCWFAEQERSRPDVSVLLYVGETGVQQLARSVESVLTQTLTAVELIVVDDTADAAVAEWLDGTRNRDARIALVRRAKPIGIPAVGWIEAFAHARAPWIVIAKTGDEFYEDALEGLLNSARADAEVIPFGFVETAVRDEATSGATKVSAGGGGVSMAVLRTRNVIARHALLIPRRAVEMVGFVDPHVLLRHAAEWDFWRRLSNCFELKAVDVAVGVTHTVMLDTELDGWALEEWMRTPRNDRLLPDRVGVYDLIASNPAHTWATRDVCADLALRLPDSSSAVDPHSVDGTEGCILIVTVQYDASTALYFDMLPEPWQHRVRVVINGPGADFSVLARATALIVSRAIRCYRPWLDAARELGVPTYYFLDDNMPVLAELGEASMSGEDFTPEAMRKDLRLFDGVLLSSEPLIAYFRERNLHARLLHFPVACADIDSMRAQLTTGRRAANDDEFVFAFMGGLHRSNAVWTVILPALVKIAEEGHRIHFVAPGSGSDASMLEGLPSTMRVTLLPWDPGYAFALRRFAALTPNYLLLAPSKTPNNSYKTLHPLLTAALVDAVAVLPRIDPYMTIEDGSIALMVDEPFERDGWYAVLREIVEGRTNARVIKHANEAFCRRAFSGVPNASALTEITSEAHGVPSWPRQSRRLSMLVELAREGGHGTAGDGAWASGLEELQALRHMRRYSWRHRVMSRPSDMWEHCGPAFWSLKRDAVKYGWRRRGGTLELSDSLHWLPHRDYDVALPTGMLGGVAFAFSTDGHRSGKATVELISPTGQRVARADRDLARADLSQPLRFMFDPVEIAEGEVWRIRVRCRTSMPVYVYEIVNRRRLGMFYGPSSPFMEILPPDPRATRGRIPAVDREAGQNSPPIDIKFVVEGDIPTNQIIQRLIVEALGDRGEVTRLLLPQFTPEALREGGLVVLSRTASPASLPMLDWMRMHGMPYVYYIDDNFWELKGDSRIAQFYQSAPVRRTLDRSIGGASHVVVNAPRLGEYIKERYPSARITQLNAPFDFSLIDNLPTPTKPANEVRVGFAGSITRADDFIEILPALKRVLDTFAHVTLVFFGYCPPELIGMDRVTFVPHVASYSDFIKMKASYGLDIGLAPMADLAANLYKTNNKYREYGAMRIAGIYTNTSPYKESVTNGLTGMLVDHSADAWYLALEKLIVDTAFRRQIAEAAYTDVRAHYAQDVVAKQWRDFLLRVASELRSAEVSTKTGRASVAFIRVRRWLGHTKIRALVLRARIKAQIVRAGAWLTRVRS